MKVAEFVGFLRENLGRDVFSNLAALAKAGKLAFGATSKDWAPKEGDGAG